MAPQMLHRVIHGRQDPEPWQKALVHFQPARLHGYRRHRVREADYPAIIACSSGSQPSRTSVLGTLVSGLTDGDMHRLDTYEGEEYVRKEVSVRVLRGSGRGGAGSGSGSGGGTGAGGTDGLQDVLDAAGTEGADEGEEVKAETYVWVAGEQELEDREWDFETFKRDKLGWWVGADESQW